MTQQHDTERAASGDYRDNPENFCVHRCAVDSGQPARLQLDRIATPIGTALLVTDEVGVLRALDFDDYQPRMLRLLRIHYGSRSLADGVAPAEIRSSLRRYFDGEFDALHSIAWATAGTPFQRSVWNALVGIASGQTMSYGELARLLGTPDAARAVGWANGSNPVAIVVPCHRVIGATGKLTGYAGGLHRKLWLLRHEGARLAQGANRDLFST
jgi:methylated-DNA-[protein]-cysteine S-methyltransferase